MMNKGIFVVVMLLLVGACSAIDPNAEGRLQDCGWFCVMGRYFMYLGGFDLRDGQEKHFRVERLPSGRDFVLAVDLKAEDCEMQKSDLQLAVKVTEEHGRTVIDEVHSLRELQWSTGANPCTPAYGYVAGRADEIRYAPGSVCMRPVITGADGGHGTAFVSRESATYSVSIRAYGRSTNTTHSAQAKIVLRDVGEHNTAAHCP